MQMLQTAVLATQTGGTHNQKVNGTCQLMKPARWLKETF